MGNEDKRLIGKMQFTGETEPGDIEALENMFDQRWNMECEVYLNYGKIYIYKE